ncbi:hypothetical protein C4D60_Mb03t07070 [Musa balbisiana]|uniref:Protein CPR-5 n=1 Tax=Musa balbisiana TaxID=52838 RepID=A0A4S8J841_MUSBA|nr:hypothetical protein C4D60_Mb03t07070 [Musa balbisiana]
MRSQFGRRSLPSSRMECARSNGSAAVDGGDGEGGRGRAGGRVDCATVRMRRWQPLERGRGVSSSRTWSTERDDASSSSSSSSRQRTQRTGMRLRNRHRSLWVPRVARGNEGLEDLALPLGMSFAAVVAQICTSAVKESITNIYGNKFDYFIRNFDKSFQSTLKTPISSEYTPDLANPEPVSEVENLQENMPLSSMSNQLIPYGQENQHLANIYHGTSNHRFSHSILDTYERSVVEQTRSNDLKAVEIGLVMEKLKLKQSQLALSSDANLLEKIKISMGISKASFKEEKLRNQMLETRHAQLLKTCIDLLVTGLIIMCGFLLYGASTYSLQRITEVTSACNYTLKESRSWWIPKSVQSFSSGWLTLRCHFVVLTRMCFGILMILVIAYLVFQRSAMSGPTMPVTFLVMLLGVVCGFTGKLCVDTLGGSGYHWLIYWEVLCMLHFFANVFPSAFHNILYGPVAVTQGANTVRLPYWVRRYAFYILLLLILPTLSGLLPFASIKEWKKDEID